MRLIRIFIIVTTSVALTLFLVIKLESISLYNLYGEENIIFLTSGDYSLEENKESRDSKPYYSLINNRAKKGEEPVIEDFVEKYKIDKNKTIIYIIGLQHKYTILNYKTGDFIHYKQLDDLDEYTRKQFESEKNYIYPSQAN